MEERKAREISLQGALMIFGTILAIIVVGRLVFTFDVALLLMFIGMFTTFTYVYYYKFTWRDLFEGGVVPMIARACGWSVATATTPAALEATLASAAGAGGCTLVHYDDTLRAAFQAAG